MAPFDLSFPASRLALAPAPDGSLIFSGLALGSDPTAYVRRYDAMGNPLSDLTALGSPVDWPAIAALPGGGYVVSHARSIAPGRKWLMGRFLDASGMPQAAPFRVDTAPFGLTTASVAALPSGPVFVWLEGSLWSRRVDLSGVPLEGVRTVAGGYLGGWADHDLAALPDGGYVVVWKSALLQPSAMRIFGADGNPTGPPSTLGDERSVRVAANAAAGIVVVGAASPQIVLRRFSLDGWAIGEPVVVHDYSPAVPLFIIVDVAVDSRGDTLVAWSGISTSGNFLGVQARLVTSGGQLPAPPLTIGSSFSVGTELAMATLADDRIGVVWGRTGLGTSAAAAVVSLCGTGSPSCGDGTLDPPCEQCDQGVANSDTAPDSCRTNCTAAACGDGVTDTGEECDDGGRLTGDGCDQLCQVQSCGNGRVEGGEICDDGDLVDEDGCDSNCFPTGCGNGHVTSGEECDDHNLDDGDGCDAACLLQVCGSGRLEGQEECDDGNLVDGDGCDSNCRLTACGNSIVTPPEECDDGGALNDDGCDHICRVEQCPNGRLEGSEICDDGNAVDGDGCETDCTPSARLEHVLKAVPAVQLTLPPTATAVSKKVRVVMANVDDAGVQIVRLTADPGTCPPGVIASPPDVNPRLDGIQDTAALEPGDRARGHLTLEFVRGAFPAVRNGAPYRCSIDVTATVVQPLAVDATASNNHVRVTVDVFDRGAASAGPEIHLRRLRAVKLRIPAASIALERTVRLKASTTEAGEPISFTLDEGDCQAGLVQLVAQNPAGSANVLIRASRAFFTTPNHQSPVRCHAVLRADAGSDTEDGNNSALLTVDVIDAND